MCNCALNSKIYRLRESSPPKYWTGESLSWMIARNSMNTEFCLFTIIGKQKIRMASGEQSKRIQREPGKIQRTKLRRVQTRGTATTKFLWLWVWGCFCCESITPNQYYGQYSCSSVYAQLPATRLHLPKRFTPVWIAVASFMYHYIHIGNLYTVCLGSTNNLTFGPLFCHEESLKCKIPPPYAIERGTMYSVPWPKFKF